MLVCHLKDKSIIPLHCGGYPICPPHAIGPILLIQPARPVPKEHVLQHGPSALRSPSIPPNEQLLVHPPALLRRKRKHDHLIRVKLLRHAAHHPPTAALAAKLEYLVSRAEHLERLDTAHHVLLHDRTTTTTVAATSFEATQPAEDAHKLGELNDPAVALARADADIDDLHAELALPVAEPKRLFPPPAAPRARERVDADGRAAGPCVCPRGGASQSG